MEYKVIELNGQQLEEIEDKLEEYDNKYITYRLKGSVRLGIEIDGEVVAGLDACMTAFKILYVSTLFVEEKFRRRGYGKILIETMEKRAKELGANTIRLDTFSFQGKEFYESMGYTVVGHYSNVEDSYEEYFFVKRI